MKQRTSFFLSAAILLLFSANAFAQFEGTISMETSSPMAGDKKMPMTISTKGDKSLIQIESPQGHMAMYNDRSTNMITMVMAERKMGFIIDGAKSTSSQDSSKDNSDVTATGQKKTINGYNCELYTVTSDKNTADWWLTSDLPKSLFDGFKSALSNPAMSRDHKSHFSPSMEKLFMKGLLPIQIESKRDGKTESTVTFLKYDQSKLDDSIFVVPSDVKIMQMPSMGGGGRE